jgi:hypothetical protein
MLLYDEARLIAHDPEAALDRVERRGLQIERGVESGLRSLEHRGNSELRRFSRNARHPVKWAQDSLNETSHYAEDELERQIEKVLERMGIPTRERLERLGREIEGLSSRIDQELLQLMSKPEGA